MDFGALMFFTDYAISAVDLAKALEERGFESVWAPEHSHIPTTRKTPFPGGGELPKQYYDAMDPFVSLTAAAIATTRLKLGTGVCLVQQRDPIQTAKLVASVDQVSNGRFLFGVGGGWNRMKWRTTAPLFETRFKLMRERIEAMKEIWTKSKACYHGDMVNFPEMLAWPKPMQKPYPPILVGGGFPQAARRAIRYGGWCPVGRTGSSLPMCWGNTGRWRTTPGAIGKPCRSPSSVRLKTRASLRAIATWVWPAWSRCCFRKSATRSSRSSTAGPL
jgi:probable F420-dependent oxidoreductase